MKKILIATNILLLGIIIFLGCSQNDSSKKEKEKTTPVETKNVSAEKCANPFCKDCETLHEEELQGTLDAMLIRELSERYVADQGKNLINGERGSQDATSIVFDIKKIKTLIAKMEQKFCENGCADSIQLGIRYYFIKYPGGLENRRDALAGLTAENNFRHSLVMVPVFKRTEGGDWFDYDLPFSSPKNCFPPIDTTRRMVSGQGILPDAGDNHGGAAPPPPTGIFPTSELP